VCISHPVTVIAGRFRTKRDIVSRTEPDWDWGTHLVLVRRLQIVEGHLLVEDGSGGARERRHDPDPVGGTAVAEAHLVLQVLHEGLGGGVVVHYGDALLLETVQDGDVHLDHRLVLPQGDGGASVQPHPLSHRLQHVQPVGVAHVPAAYLGAHVPAVKGGGGELQAPHVEHHARDCGQAVPFQAEVLEPVQPEPIGGLSERTGDKERNGVVACLLYYLRGMCQWDLEDQL
jgi:hypothetical protein